jgi:hypothetical protein
MEELKQKSENADKKLAELKSATAETWEKMKAETDKAVEELNFQYNKMMSRFKKP